MNGITNLWPLAIATLIWIVYATYVARIIRNSGQYDAAQLKLQTVLAFAIPLLGAIIVHFMHLGTQAKEPNTDRHHAAQGDQIGMNPSARSANVED